MLQEGQSRAFVLMESGVSQRVLDSITPDAMTQDISFVERVSGVLKNVSGSADTTFSLQFADGGGDTGRIIIDVSISALTCASISAKKENLGIQGQTTGNAQKVITITERGIFTSPTTITSPFRTNTKLTTVHSNRIIFNRLARGIATNMYYKSKAQEERKASCKAEQQLKQELDEQIDREIQKLNADYQRLFVDRFLKPGYFPAKFRMMTMNDRFYIQNWASPDEFPIEDYRLPPSAGTSDINVLIHEQLANHILTLALAGKRLSKESLRQAFSLLPVQGFMSAEEIKFDDTLTNQYYFANDRPAEIAFIDQKVVIDIYLASEALPKLTKIRVEFESIPRESGRLGSRRGKIEVTAVNPATREDETEFLEKITLGAIEAYIRTNFALDLEFKDLPIHPLSLDGAKVAPHFYLLSEVYSDHGFLRLRWLARDSQQGQQVIVDNKVSQSGGKCVYGWVEVPKGKFGADTRVCSIASVGAKQSIAFLTDRETRTCSANAVLNATKITQQVRTYCHNGLTGGASADDK